MAFPGPMPNGSRARKLFATQPFPCRAIPVRGNSRKREIVFDIFGVGAAEAALGALDAGLAWGMGQGQGQGACGRGRGMWHVAGACAGACGRGKGRGRGMGQGQGQGRGRGSEHRVSRRGGAGGEERERERSRGRKRRWTRSPGAPGTSVLGTEGKPGACHPARVCVRAFTHCLIVAPTAALDVQHPFVGVGCAVRLADVHGGVATVEADRALVLCLHTPHATRHTQPTQACHTTGC